MTAKATIWRKTPTNRLLVGLDWAPQLNGATIAGLPTITDVPAGLTCTYAGVDGTVQKFWLAGDPGVNGGHVMVAITSSIGENLDHICPVRRL